MTKLERAKLLNRVKRAIKTDGIKKVTKRLGYRSASTVLYWKAKGAVPSSAADKVSRIYGAV